MTDTTRPTTRAQAAFGAAAHSGEANAERGESMIDRAVAEARSVRIKDSLATVKVIAPAKVNLHLGIGPRRPDGFHAVETVLHAVSLHDVLYVQRTPGMPGEGLQVQLTCTFHEGLRPVGIRPEDNLVYRAVYALAEALERHEDETLTMLLEKRIPLQAGLGGGSSDAAAALMGAARAWDVPEDDMCLEETARSLGADVAFFLRGGCGFYEGRGDRFVRAIEPSRRALVLVKPDAGVSTAKAYAAFDQRPVYVTDEERAVLASARSAQDVRLWNNLAPAAEQLLPELADVRAWLIAQPGVEAAMLSGSGSATFALCDSSDVARTVATEALKRGWWARATSLSPARAAIVPR